MSDSDEIPDETPLSDDTETPEGDDISFDEVMPLDEEDDSLGQSEIDDE